MLTKFNQHILLRLTFYSYKYIIFTNTDTICRVLNIIAFASEGHEAAKENHYYFKENNKDGKIRRKQFNKKRESGKRL